MVAFKVPLCNTLPALRAPCSAARRLWEQGEGYGVVPLRNADLREGSAGGETHRVFVLSAAITSVLREPPIENINNHIFEFFSSDGGDIFILRVPSPGDR